MSYKNYLALFSAIILTTSCAHTSKFPVSDLVPAADITAKIKKQGKLNYLIIITANNLAASNRLNPPKEIYIIWAVSESRVTRNVGYFIQQNAEKAIYQASFPYRPIEVFITAEDEEDLCKPSGVEISRTKL